MVLDAVERVLEELERVANPREMTLFLLAAFMILCGALSISTPTVSVALVVIGSGMFFVGIFLPVLTEFQIGPGGFSAKLRERDQEVRATLEPHTNDLLQTAEMLTGGNPEAGKELLERALIETYLRWREAKAEGPIDTVRRQLDLLAQPAAVGAAIQAR
jgi:hypothetical protein